jgi:hypothetical protein
MRTTAPLRGAFAGRTFSLADISRSFAALRRLRMTPTLSVILAVQNWSGGRLAPYFVASFARPARMSIGSGKTIVVFFSTPISVRVCR